MKSLKYALSALLLLTIFKSHAEEPEKATSAADQTATEQKSQPNKVESITADSASDPLSADKPSSEPEIKSKYKLDAAATQDKSTKKTLGLHLLSIHSAPGFNDHNQGLYIEFENHFTLGHYYNSVYKETTYAGYTYSLTKHIDLTLALFTGYQVYRYAPLVVPTYKFPNLFGTYTMRFAFIPKIPNVINANVLHAMLESSF